MDDKSHQGIEATPTDDPTALGGNIQKTLEERNRELGQAIKTTLAEAVRLAPALEATNTPDDNVTLEAGAIRHRKGAKDAYHWITQVSERGVFKYTNNPNQRWVEIALWPVHSYGSINQDISKVRELTEPEAIGAAEDLLTSVNETLQVRLRQFEEVGGALDTLVPSGDLNDILSA